MSKIDKKAKILLTAQKYFVEKGYDGVSLRDIAKHANVPIGSIYYYFNDKQDLWKAIKLNISKDFFNEDILSYAPDHDLKELLEYIVTKRFELYLKNPDLARLIQWQGLEASNKKLNLIGFSNEKLKIWQETIKNLQINNQIRSDWNAEYILIFILTSSTAPFVMYTQLFNDNYKEQDKDAYLKMILEIMYQGLKA